MGDYTIDVSKLRNDGARDNGTNRRPSKASSLPPSPPQPDFERVSSHDDGPTDFTLNMEQWMRGSQACGQNDTEVPEASAPPRNPTAEDYPDESAFIPQSTSTPAHHAPSAQKRTAPDSYTPSIVDLEAELESAKAENASLEAQLKHAQKESASLQAQLQSTRTSRIPKTDDLRTEVERITKEKQALLTQITTTKTSLTTKITSLETQLSTSKAAQTAAISSTQILAAELQHAQQQLQSTLALVETMQSVVIDTAQQRERQKSTVAVAVRSCASQTDAPPTPNPDLKTVIATLTSQISSAHSALAAQAQRHDAVNAALDQRFANAMSQREQYWKAKLEGVVKERDALKEEKRMMGRVLMQCWGREELGAPGERKEQGKGAEKRPARATIEKGKGQSSSQGQGQGQKEMLGQAYRYKYVKKGSAKPAGRRVQIRDVDSLIE
ncbi:hypothetical protein MMC16_004905 [Acarospora aff. strigata]|nr:hypothetical protein [Acarospora aff. strigata]